MGYTIDETDDGKFNVVKDGVIIETHDTREDAEEALADLIDEDDEAASEEE